MITSPQSSITTVGAIITQRKKLILLHFEDHFIATIKNVPALIPALRILQLPENIVVATRQIVVISGRVHVGGDVVDITIDSETLYMDLSILEPDSHRR